MVSDASLGGSSSVYKRDMSMVIQHSRLDWIGLDWIGLDWIGLDYSVKRASKER